MSDTPKLRNEHYMRLAEEVDRLTAENEAIKESLKDPAVIHANILRGIIARPSDATLLHIMGEDMTTLHKDAMRYRWLRHGDNDDEVMDFHYSGQAYLLRNEKLDAAIDAAMAKEQS